MICSPISNQVVDVAVEKYPHLQGLTLADEVDSSHDAEIDILIGADYYWNFVKTGGAVWSSSSSDEVRLGVVRTSEYQLWW